MGDIRIPIWLVSLPVLAYGLAWVFFDRFFWTYGIELRTISIPPEHYFAWGTQVFMWVLVPEDLTVEGFLPHIFTVLALAALLLPKTNKYLTSIRWPLFSLMLAVAVFLLFGRAAQLGEAEARLRERPQFATQLEFIDMAAVAETPAPAVADAANQDEPPPRSARGALQQANARGALRMIWQDDETTMVGEPRYCESGVCRWVIFRVQTQQISVTRSEKGNDEEAP